MRCLLIVAGLLGLIVGVHELSGNSPPGQTFGAAWLVTGAILFAFGSATCYIVSAIARSKAPQKPADDPDE